MRSYIWQGEFGNEIMIGYPEVCWAASQGELTVWTRNAGAPALYVDLCQSRTIAEKEEPLTEAQLAFAGKNMGFYSNSTPDKNLSRNRVLRPLRLDISWPRRRKRQVVIHARHINGHKQNRNWHHRLDPAIDYLKDIGYRVICIGQKEQSLHLHGTENHIGENLSTVIGLIKESAFLLGPAGGPHLLATFCCTPVFSWNCKDQRLFPGREGNPFGVAHFHPWSAEPDGENMKRYHSMAYPLSWKELQAGLDFMIMGEIV